MHIGRCLCGEIEFKVELIEGQVYSCHCTICQRSHGAAFATQAFADGRSLQFTRGEEKLSSYFSGGGYRTFCPKCGSRLINHAEDRAQYTSVAVACLTDKMNIDPVANVCIESKLVWNELNKEIPAFEGIPKAAVE